MDKEYVGIDFHRRRSVVVHLDGDGERVSLTRIDNTPAALAASVADAGEAPEVVLEATYGWYWAADLLADVGASVHLANPRALNWGERRVKNDVADATDLAHMLRLGRLPEAWIAPPDVRELRELVRYRAKLVQLRSGLKAQVHAVMAKHGVLPSVVDMFGPAGQRQLDELQLEHGYTVRVESLRDLIETEMYGAEFPDRSNVRFIADCVTTAAIWRCRRSTVSGARSRRSSSLRSATSPASRHHAICVRGLG